MNTSKNAHIIMAKTSRDSSGALLNSLSSANRRPTDTVLRRQNTIPAKMKKGASL